MVIVQYTPDPILIINALILQDLQGGWFLHGACIPLRQEVQNPGLDGTCRGGQDSRRPGTGSSRVRTLRALHANSGRAMSEYWILVDKHGLGCHACLPPMLVDPSFCADLAWTLGTSTFWGSLDFFS